ncbi:MAG: hypothetical protein ACKOZW_02040 [Cyanobium sp.]
MQPAGQGLLPGFINTHGHFLSFGKNLLAANLVGASSSAEIIRRLGDIVAKHWGPRRAANAAW